MDILKFVIFMVVAMISIVLHECAHAYVALLNGDNTAQLSGRLTLNPARHFDIIGFLLFAFCGVGFAKAVPINPSKFKNKKVGILTVSLSGVTLNLIISFIAALIIVVLQTYLQPEMTTTTEGERGYDLIVKVFDSFLVVGINLFLFNILPIYPLDGYNVVEGIFGCKSSFVRWLRDYAKYILLSLIITFGVAYLCGLPNAYNPAHLYMSGLGGKIKELFLNFWGTLFA